MPRARHRWQGWAGLSRLVSRTAMPADRLWEAKGVVAVERGRMRPMWEGRQAAQYAGRDLYWPALTAYSAESGSAPEVVVAWPAAQRSFAASLYAGAFDGITDRLVDNMPKQTYTGVAITRGDEEVAVSITAAIPWRSRVRITDDSGTTTEYTAMTAHPNTTPATAKVRLDRPYEGATSTNATVEIDMSGRVWAADMGDWLIVCHERQPARAVHKAELNRLTADQWSGISQPSMVAHAPVWLGHGHYAEGDATLSWSSPEFTAASARFRTAGTSLHGYGATLPAGYDSYQVAVQLFGRNSAQDPEDALTHGFAGVVTGDTTMDLSPGGSLEYNATTGVPYRIAYPGAHAYYRYPVQYRGRFCAVEGRLLSRLSGYNAGAGATALINKTVATDPVAIAADISDTVSDGDWLVLYDTPTAGNVDIDTAGVYAAKIRYVRVSSGTTYMYLDVPTDFFAGASSTNVLCHMFRRLSPAERRQVWFTGRPANSALGISRGDRDWAWLDSSNGVIVGEDSEGDITALIAQGDDRLIVGLESAIYEIVGDPPIDGTPPPGFDVRRLAGGVGIYRDTAAVWDDTGQVLYFCSGTDFGLYRLSGQAVDPNRVDADIWDHPQHPRHRGVGFRHVVISDKRLWAMTDETQPVLWCLDLQTGGWTWTDRSNSASGQTGANPAVDPADPAYTGTPNYLYESGNPGLIAAPLRRLAGEPDALMCCYRDTDYKLRTLCDSANIHTDGALLHGVQIETPFLDGAGAQLRLRSGSIDITTPIQLSQGGATLAGLIVSLTDSEGQQALTRTLSGPDYADTAGDSQRYYFPGQPGRGVESLALRIGDGVAPVGEVAAIGADVIATMRRRR